MADRTCSIDGCETKLIARGWCSMHYQRWRHHGDPCYERPVLPTICTIEDCDKSVQSKGFCSNHYRRLWLYGDPLKSFRRPNGEMLAWLQSVVDDPPEECVDWPFEHVNAGGYGFLHFKTCKQNAHHVALVLYSGEPLEDGMYACHRPVDCHRRLCVNPTHLRWDTPGGNSLDRIKDGTYGWKLTAETVMAIRADNRPASVVARDYGISRGHVFKVRAGRVWSGLPLSDIP